MFFSFFIPPEFHNETTNQLSSSLYLAIVQSSLIMLISTCYFIPLPLEDMQSLGVGCFPCICCYTIWCKFLGAIKLAISWINNSSKFVVMCTRYVCEDSYNFCILICRIEDNRLTLNFFAVDIARAVELYFACSFTIALTLIIL